MNRSLTQFGAGRPTVKSYAAGFLLALLLTGASFALVMNRALSRPVTIVAIFGAAFVQSLVHIHYFLHLDMSSSSRWNVLALIFTVLIMAIFIGGTIWIMYDLNGRMM
ncbi:MAG: cytochrome o ubiquinol oxidase subunit IV [Syntrophobacteraceae bacterium]|nr:cytochrome o ubiquinol oxidase subunit IV [Syntrophobacteraceae bacterium]